MINQIIQGDCLEVLKSIPDNYFDSLITDPPCGISFMGKNWDDHKGGMLQWINWMSEVMSEAMRTMKPGACGLVWSIPRTSHWTGMALELAGFKLIDVVHHCNGSGFPKGQDIGKILDKMAGEEREITGTYKARGFSEVSPTNDGRNQWASGKVIDKMGVMTAPATPEAKQWDGWKTPALKPSVEGWWLVQKQISESSIARNILKHGVGGLNIEACRIDTEESLSGGSVTTTRKNPMSGDDRQGKSLGMFAEGSARKDDWIQPNGRYPANLILSCSADCEGDHHSPSCPVSVIGEQSGISVSSDKPRNNGDFKSVVKGREYAHTTFGHNDQGTAARYFKQLPFDPETVNSVYYQAKASTKDRTCNGVVNNVHPTVKSTALMEYFIKLITPPCGIVLDPFGGSGTTAIAAKNLGFNYTLIEKEQEYIDIINQRLDIHASASDLGTNARSPHPQSNKVISIEKHKQLSLFG
jgi:site-specific DNA-methyltransferase (adenine-specific)